MPEFGQVGQEGERQESDLGPDPQSRYGILFGGDGVLYSRPHKGQHWAAFLRPDESPPSQDRILELEDLAQRGVISLLEYRRRKLIMHGITDPARIQAGIEMMQRGHADISFPEGIVETLETLRQRGYRLAVISNTSLPLRDTLAYFERGGFGHVWDQVILSAEVGSRKPDPAIYEAALQSLGILAQHTVYVGHDPQELAGAEQLGIQTVGFCPDPEAKPRVVVSAFLQLLDLIPKVFN